ncbi:hypothetical protein L345_05838 [Ophiophagus hannah]|uniref:Uncharacterized protein n=1 Tax=Ophiophagus hannah TaxID=8665 RepID=V8P231_OPHHA|nr:hypothetical protein L345_05838 [Ophiophagus hannah]
MKASWLGLLVLASFSLLLAARSEEAPPVSGAPEVVTESLPLEAFKISKAWWKKFIQETGRQGQPRTPRPGVFSPLSANETMT